MTAGRSPAYSKSKVANNQVIGQKQSAMATFLACLEDREDFDQEQADYIKTFLSTMSARRGGRGRGGKRGGTRGGHVGNNNTKANSLKSPKSVDDILSLSQAGNSTTYTNWRADAVIFNVSILIHCFSQWNYFSVNLSKRLRTSERLRTLEEQ